MKLPSLRQYQSRGIEMLREYQSKNSTNYNAYNRSIVCALSTGGGKTVIAIYLIIEALSQGTKCLFIVDDKSLVSQTVKRFSEYGVNCGVIAASVGKNPCPNAPIQIAGIKTLVNREIPKDIGLVLIDECHTCGYSEHQRWWAQTKPDGTWALWRKDAWVIGLTATPERTNPRQALNELYSECIPIAYSNELIAIGKASGWTEGLVPPVYYGFQAVLDLSKVGEQAGDYRPGDLALAVDTPEVTKNLIQQWEALCVPDGILKRRKRTMFYAVSLDHARNIADAFNYHFRERALDEGFSDGIIWKMLEGGDEDAERSYWINRLRGDDLCALAVKDLFTKGTDIPPLECVFVRPTKSPVVKTQQEGRGARPCPEIGKTQFIIVDYGLNILKPGFTRFDEPLPYSIEPRKKAPPGDAPEKQCPECNRIIRASQMICECGHVFTPKEKERTEITGKLVKLLSKEEKAFAAKFKRHNRKAYENNQDPATALRATQIELSTIIPVEEITPGILVQIRKEWLLSNTSFKQGVTMAVRVTGEPQRRPTGGLSLATNQGECHVPAHQTTITKLPEACPQAMRHSFPYRKDRDASAPTEKEMSMYYLYLSKLARKLDRDAAWCLRWYDAEFGADAPRPAALSYGKAG